MSDGWIQQAMALCAAARASDQQPQGGQPRADRDVPMEGAPQTGGRTASRSPQAVQVAAASSQGGPAATGTAQPGGQSRIPQAVLEAMADEPLTQPAPTVDRQPQQSQPSPARQLLPAGQTQLQFKRPQPY